MPKAEDASSTSAVAPMPNAAARPPAESSGTSMSDDTAARSRSRCVHRRTAKVAATDSTDGSA